MDCVQLFLRTFNNDTYVLNLYLFRRPDRGAFFNLLSSMYNSGLLVKVVFHAFRNNK